MAEGFYFGGARYRGWKEEELEAALNEAPEVYRDLWEGAAVVFRKDMEGRSPVYFGSLDLDFGDGSMEMGDDLEVVVEAIKQAVRNAAPEGWEGFGAK